MITAFKVKVTAKVQMSVNVCPDIFSLCGLVHSLSPEPLNHFFFFITKVGMVVYYHEAMCHTEKNWFTVYNDIDGLYNQNMTFLLYLGNCWSVCNQPWFDSTAS